MPKQVDHEKYRRELLEQSFECFADRGYGKLTMRELAASLGVSTGTLYHYFPNKRAIFETLIEHLADRDLMSGAELISRHKGVSKRVKALYAFLEENKDYFVKQNIIWIDFIRQEGVTEASSNPVMFGVYLKYRDWLAGYLDIVDEELLTMVCCLLNGYIFEMMGPHEHLTMKTQAKFLTKLLKLHSDT